MRINTLGQYNFNNYTLLNPLMSENEEINTAIHEYTHFILSTQSTYGIILYCLERIITQPQDKNDSDKKDIVKKFFFDNTQKVQECIAVFMECVYYMQKDLNEYKDFIDNIKNNNREYYKYIMPLCFILDQIKSEKSCDRLKIARAVYQIALKSMNAKIYEKYKGNQFGSKAEIRKLVSNQEFSKEFLPNKTFFKMIKSCKKAESFCVLYEKLIELIDSDDSSREELSNVKLESIKKFVLEIFSDSKNLNNYRIMLDKITVKEKDYAEIFLQQLPTTFNLDYISNKLTNIEYEELKKNCIINSYSTILLIGNLKNVKLYFSSKIGLDSIVSNINESLEIIIYYNLLDKTIFSSFISEQDIQELLEMQDNKSVILIFYKNYDYKKDCILGHNVNNKRIYIYCDNTYINITEIIDKWSHRIIYYRYMLYDRMTVLLIKISKDTIFLLPMSSIVADEAEADILKNRRNMLQITEYGEDEFDSCIITNEIIRDEIDKIINSLFFINIEFE